MSTDENLPWTTSRCNRLLRPISSRLTTLRKELDRRRQALGEAPNASNALSQTPPSKPNSSQGKRAKLRGFDKTMDPDWAPGANSGGASKKTYRRRGSKKPISVQQTASENAIFRRPGEIALATPFIARTRQRLQDSPYVHGSPLKNATKKRGPLIAKVEQLQLLKAQMTPTIWKLVNGLFDAYANLLEATKVDERKTRKGTRSLMATCLQEMPKYIALEVHFVQLEEEEAGENEERDVSAEVYTWLEEQFGTHTGQGWRHLRQIVRAHGTALMCDAFEDQLLGLEMLEAVVSLCMKVSAWDEIEKFMWTFLPFLKPLPIPVNVQSDLFGRQTSVYMNIVNKFVAMTQRHQFLYDQLEYMVSQELLPVEWLATVRMGPIWSRIVSILSDGDHRTYANAFHLLETAVCIGVGLPDDSVLDFEGIGTLCKSAKVSSSSALREALDTTFSSLFTLLAGITLARRAERQKVEEIAVHEVTWVLDSLAVGLLKRKSIMDELERRSPDEDRLRAYAKRALWSLAAPFLIHLEGSLSQPGMTPINHSMLVRSFHWLVSQYSLDDINVYPILETLPTFISSIARCSGRPRKHDGFDELQRLVDGMLSKKSLQSPHKSWSLQRLALDSALEFAHSTGDPQHIAYVRRVETSLTRKGRVMLNSSNPSNHSPSSRAGFHWEEGIGEWVACTPFARQAAQPVAKSPMYPLELLPTLTPSDNESEGDGVSCPTDDKALERQLHDGSLLDHGKTLDGDTSPHLSPIMQLIYPEPVKFQRKRLLAVMIVPRHATSSPSKRLRLSSGSSTLHTLSTLQRRGSQRTLKQLGVLTPESSDLQNTSTFVSQPRRSHHTKLLARTTVHKKRVTPAPASVQNEYQQRENKGNNSITVADDSDSSINLDDVDELANTSKKRNHKWAERIERKKKPRQDWWVPQTMQIGGESEDELSFQ